MLRTVTAADVLFGFERLDPQWLESFEPQWLEHLQTQMCMRAWKTYAITMQCYTPPVRGRMAQVTVRVLPLGSDRQRR